MEQAGRVKTGGGGSAAHTGRALVPHMEKFAGSLCLLHLSEVSLLRGMALRWFP